MKKIIAFIITGLLISPASLLAQIDEQKMDKDLRVATTVLESLTQGNERGHLMYNDNIEANYVDGYGVIFTMGEGPVFYMTGKRASAYAYRSRGTVIVAPSTDKEDKKLETTEVDQVDVSQMMIEFLVDYSQMINQLKSNDKIMISTSKSDTSFPVVIEGSTGFSGLPGVSAEMVKKDHEAYLSGKLSREKLIEKIKVTKNDGESLRSKDLDLFSSMLSTVYDDEYTDSYFISWKPEYQRLEGVGAIFSFKVYSSYDEDGWYRMPGVDKKGLDSEQRKAEVEKLYPVFVKSMRENIVQYGRTITSLAPEEMILLKVTLTKCDGCAIPKKVQFSIKQADLTAFRSGKMSEKEAIERVMVTDL